MVHTWVKDYIKYHGYYFESVFMFLLRKGGTNKSDLVKVIYNTMSQVLRCHCKNLRKKNKTWNYGNISNKYRWDHYSFWS